VANLSAGDSADYGPHLRLEVVATSGGMAPQRSTQMAGPSPRPRAPPFWRSRACARAGIPRCTPNDLRRTYSTWLRADGVPNELSAPTMGDKDTRMLDRVYARLPPELLRERLLAALGRCSAGAVNTSGGGAQNGPPDSRPQTQALGNWLPEVAGLEPGNSWCRSSRFEITSWPANDRTRQFCAVMLDPFRRSSIGSTAQAACPDKSTIHPKGFGRGRRP
jgi:hypothetical protein